MKKKNLESLANKLLYPNKKKKKRKIEKINYALYIKSKLWRKRRNEFYKKNKKECAICSSIYKVGLHHITYKNLGKERDSDLVPLCWNCHKEYHNHFEHNDKKGFKEFVKDMKWYYKNKDETI